VELLMPPPLAGVKVVEAASYISGPWAAMMLADLGAEVVKVEPPKGDQFRRFGGARVSAVWVSVNRGKRNVLADLKTDAGVKTLLELIRDADVFISNWRPEVAERLGVGDTVLAAANPRLIRLWITGLGPTGPSADAPAFDAVIQARSALIDASSRDHRLEVLPGWPVDKYTATMGAQAVLAALFQRERTGVGERIDLAMLDATAYIAFPDLMTSRTFVVDAEPADAHSVSASVLRTLPASDGSFVIAAVTGRQIKAVCAAVGHPEWATELFADPVELVANMNRLFSPVTVQRPLSHWMEVFTQHDVPASACYTIDQHLADLQVLHNDVYAVEDWPEMGRVRTVRHPAVVASWGRLSGGPAPAALDS
jgi:crotonobetainyl-CoA:carnitine CoA-transferase CaiB-like acyl-CoA transferase